MIPSYQLSTLYIKGSLKNVENGFELSIRNTIDSGHLIGLGPIQVDGTSYPAEAITWKTAVGEWRADQISFRSPLLVSLYTEAKVIVTGQPLAPGTHQLILTAAASETGRIQFTISDTIA